MHRRFLRPLKFRGSIESAAINDAPSIAAIAATLLAADLEYSM
jgi:hypothetical protein